MPRFSGMLLPLTSYPAYMVLMPEFEPLPVVEELAQLPQKRLDERKKEAGGRTASPAWSDGDETLYGKERGRINTALKRLKLPGIFCKIKTKETCGVCLEARARTRKIDGHEQRICKSCLRELHTHEYTKKLEKSSRSDIDGEACPLRSRRATAAAQMANKVSLAKQALRGQVPVCELFKR